MSLFRGNLFQGSVFGGSLFKEGLFDLTPQHGASVLFEKMKDPLYRSKWEVRKFLAKNPNVYVTKESLVKLFYMKNAKKVSQQSFNQMLSFVESLKSEPQIKPKWRVVLRTGRMDDFELKFEGVEIRAGSKRFEALEKAIKDWVENKSESELLKLAALLKLKNGKDLANLILGKVEEEKWRVYNKHLAKLHTSAGSLDTGNVPKNVVKTAWRKKAEESGEIQKAFVLSKLKEAGIPESAAEVKKDKKTGSFVIKLKKGYEHANFILKNIAKLYNKPTLTHGKYSLKYTGGALVISFPKTKTAQYVKFEEKGELYVPQAVKETVSEEAFRTGAGPSVKVSVVSQDIKTIKPTAEMEQVLEKSVKEAVEKTIGMSLAEHPDYVERTDKGFKLKSGVVKEVIEKHYTPTPSEFFSVSGASKDIGTVLMSPAKPTSTGKNQSRKTAQAPESEMDKMLSEINKEISKAPKLVGEGIVKKVPGTLQSLVGSASLHLANVLETVNEPIREFEIERGVDVPAFGWSSKQIKKLKKVYGEDKEKMKEVSKELHKQVSENIEKGFKVFEAMNLLSAKKFAYPERYARKDKSGRYDAVSYFSNVFGWLPFDVATTVAAGSVAGKIAEASDLSKVVSKIGKAGFIRSTGIVGKIVQGAQRATPFLTNTLKEGAIGGAVFTFFEEAGAGMQGKVPFSDVGRAISSFESGFKATILSSSVVGGLGKVGSILKSVRIPTPAKYVAKVAGEAVRGGIGAGVGVGYYEYEMAKKAGATEQEARKVGLSAGKEFFVLGSVLGGLAGASSVYSQLRRSRIFGHEFRVVEPEPIVLSQRARVARDFGVVDRLVKVGDTFKEQRVVTRKVFGDIFDVFVLEREVPHPKRIPEIADIREGGITSEWKLVEKRQVKKTIKGKAVKEQTLYKVDLRNKKVELAKAKDIRFVVEVPESPFRRSMKYTIFNKSLLKSGRILWFDTTKIGSIFDQTTVLGSPVGFELTTKMTLNKGLKVRGASGKVDVSFVTKEKGVFFEPKAEIVQKDVYVGFPDVLFAKDFTKKYSKKLSLRQDIEATKIESRFSKRPKGKYAPVKELTLPYSALEVYPEFYFPAYKSSVERIYLFREELPTVRITREVKKGREKFSGGLVKKNSRKLHRGATRGGGKTPLHTETTSSMFDEVKATVSEVFEATKTISFPSEFSGVKSVEPMKAEKGSRVLSLSIPKVDLKEKGKERRKSTVLEDIFRTVSQAPGQNVKSKQKAKQVLPQLEKTRLKYKTISLPKPEQNITDVRLVEQRTITTTVPVPRLRTEFKFDIPLPPGIPPYGFDFKPKPMRLPLPFGAPKPKAKLKRKDKPKKKEGPSFGLMKDYSSIVLGISLPDITGLAPRGTYSEKQLKRLGVIGKKKKKTKTKKAKKSKKKKATKKKQRKKKSNARKPKTLNSILRDIFGG